MQAFECLGHWWVPGPKREVVAGSLKVSQSGDLRLSLIGALGQPDDLPLQNHSVIFGQVDKAPLGRLEQSAGGALVTLTDARLSGSTFGSSFTRRERYYVSRSYFGAHISNPADFEFRGMSLHLSGLSEWANGYSGFSGDAFPFGENDGPTPILSYTRKDTLTAQIPGARLNLGLALNMEGGDRQRVFRESVAVSVTCEEAKSVDQLNSDFVCPLQNLMTFVSDRAQEVNEFAVRHLNVDGHIQRNDIRVIGPRMLTEEDEIATEPVHYFQMLFTLMDVDFTSFIGKWLKITDRFSDACSAFFGLAYGPPAFLDLTFPTVVQALHLYYSRRADGMADRVDTETRIKQIIASISQRDASWIAERMGSQLAPPIELSLRTLVEEHARTIGPLVSNRCDRFINEAINTLRYIVHREPEMKAAANQGADLYWMIQKLRFLFKSCLLHELGFEFAKISEFFDRNPLYQHVRSLEAAEEARRQQG